MTEPKRPGRRGNSGEARRESEECNAAEGRSVAAGDFADAELSPAVSLEECEEDPWDEVMRDFGRLVVGAFEADPHRFD